jgi:hypothetical protein
MSSTKWTWVSGDRETSNGSLIQLGQYDPQNKPASRTGFASAYDPDSAEFYLWSGVSKGASQNSWGSIKDPSPPDSLLVFLNDLWSYDPALNLWACLFSSDQVAGSYVTTVSTGYPKGRVNSSATFDPNTKLLFVFGGQSSGRRNRKYAILRICRQRLVKRFVELQYY